GVQKRSCSALPSFMEVLFIDAFGQSVSARTQCHRVTTKIRSHLCSNLYTELEYTDSAAIAAFDKVDAVIIDGDFAGNLPWESRMRQVVLVVRACLLTEKCLVATGPGAAVVAFVCATGGPRMTVVNGGGAGTDMSVRLPPPPPQPAPPPPPPPDTRANASAAVNALPPPQRRRPTAPPNVALDSVTGDYFLYDAATTAWIPAGNVGIRRRWAVIESKATYAALNGSVHPARTGAAVAGSGDGDGHRICCGDGGD
ncbi:unnamed protein product, partial [Phaeothamnion confervicola]